MKKGIRLDTHLSSDKFGETVEKARNKIVSGWVKIDGETIREPGRIVSGMENISIERPGGNYVSRGGQKLRHALDYFNIQVSGKNTADLGSSTGGFTDCLLQAGAAKVYSIDVGYGLLDYSLRMDPRVIVRERINVRNLKKDDFDEKIDFITADLSFISIIKVFETIKKLFTPVQGIILIKPQFEAEKNKLEKGVVSDTFHNEILQKTIIPLIKKGLIFKGLHFSPIKGPAGNIEFLLYFELKDEAHTECDIPENLELIIESVVEEAHKKLS